MPGNQIRIMVVDDDPEIPRLIQALIPADRFKISTAFHTQDALTKFRDEHPQLIFLDIHMPGASGFVALRRLRSLAADTSRDVKIIMLTAQKTKEDVTTALAYGADDYLVKPFTKETLIAKIDRHFPG